MSFWSDTWLGFGFIWFIGSWLGAIVWLIWVYKKKVSTVVSLIVTIVTIIILELFSYYITKTAINYQPFITLNLAFLYAIIGFALVGVGDGGSSEIQKPNSTVTFANVKWGEGTSGHGIVFTIKGTKEASFVAKQVTLQIEGESFWQAVGSGGGSALVTLAKWSFLPLTLCPKYLVSNPMNKDETTFNFEIGIGTKQNGTFGAQHATITDKLNDIIKAGDPSLNLIFEGDGSLMFGLTTTASRLLECLSSKNVNFPLLFTSPYAEEKKETKKKEKKENKKEEVRDVTNRKKENKKQKQQQQSQQQSQPQQNKETNKQKKDDEGEGLQDEETEGEKEIEGEGEAKDTEFNQETEMKLKNSIEDLFSQCNLDVLQESTVLLALEKLHSNIIEGHKEQTLNLVKRCIQDYKKKSSEGEK